MDAISSLKLTDLKRELRARNLSSTGSKQILVDRLIEAMSAEKATDGGDDSNIDDLLDEDSMLGGEESDTGSDDNVAADLEITSPTATIPPVSLTSPTKSQDSLKRAASASNADQNGTSNGDGAPPSKKKIILNRQPVPEAAPQVLPVVSVSTAESVASSKAVTEGNDPAAEAGEKAVIKLSEVTAAPITDKLKLRQEKFKADLPTTAEAADKLKKRADRFGVVAASGKASVTPEDDAKLTKRQERFGIPTTEKTDELKQKRAARFGLNAKSAPDSAEVEEKKKLRAARFAAAL